MTDNKKGSTQPLKRKRGTKRKRTALSDNESNDDCDVNTDKMELKPDINNAVNDAGLDINVNVKDNNDNNCDNSVEVVHSNVDVFDEYGGNELTDIEIVTAIHKTNCKECWVLFISNYM